MTDITHPIVITLAKAVTDKAQGGLRQQHNGNRKSNKSSPHETRSLHKQKVFSQYLKSSNPEKNAKPPPKVNPQRGLGLRKQTSPRSPPSVLSRRLGGCGR